MSTLYYESSFSHHGIKGQRWGFRRYQNKDGSLTPRGQRRYQQELQKITAAQQAERRRVALEQVRVREARKTEQAKLKLKSEQEGLRNDKHRDRTKKNDTDNTPKKDIKSFSNEELKAIIDRADLEKKYNQIVSSDNASRVPKWISDIGKTALKNIVSKAAESYGQSLGKKLAREPESDNKKKDKDNG